MSSDTTVDFDILSLPDAERIDQACDRFENAWRAGDWPCIEGYLDSVSGPARRILLKELVKLEIELRRSLGESPSRCEYELRFPAERAVIEAVFGSPPSGQGETTVLDEPTGPYEGPMDPTTVAIDAQNPASQTDVNGAVGKSIGDYLILDRIGRGGMGVVYRALQRRTRRIVALKLIKAEWWGDSTAGSRTDLERRFRDEAEILAALDHENIVTLYEAGHENGLLYFSMRLIKGRSLAQMVRSEGPLPPRKAAYYIESIAHAIAHAHLHNVVHRDLKPSNIMVDEHDRPYLIDLGLAKSLEATEFGSNTDRVLGTAEYMSPEQAGSGKKVGKAVDVYGLGATLFAILTGRAPFTGQNMVVVVRKVLEEEPCWPKALERSIDPELKAICLKCLEKDPESRLPGAAALATALQNYLEFRPTGVSTPSRWARVVKWVRRQPWRATALGVACLGILAATLGALESARKTRTLAQSLANDVLTVSLDQLPDKIKQADALSSWIGPILHASETQAEPGEDRSFRIDLALAGWEPDRRNQLARRIASLSPTAHRIACDRLRNSPEALGECGATIRSQASSLQEQIRAAAALIATGAPQVEIALDQLKASRDPERRIALLNFLVEARVDPGLLQRQALAQNDPSIRCMLFQALAELPAPAENPAELTGGNSLLIERYRTDPDAGVHAAIGMVLRHRGAAADVTKLDLALANEPLGERRWFVTSWGETMAIVGARHDPNPLLPSELDGAGIFAIALTETTARDFGAFEPSFAKRRSKSGADDPWQDDKPADFITYDRAAAYCNWRSKQEGLPESEWCYSEDPENHRMVMALDYRRRLGYRLPTIEEWEIAARAGTSTDRYFGKHLTNVARYAWSRRNVNFHAQPVARLRPNDYGLFDVIGNLSEWCYNPVPPHDPLCQCGAIQGSACKRFHFVSERGGCFYYPDTELRAHPLHQLLDWRKTDESYNYNGFRIARSLASRANPRNLP